jgi:hypothetical protein
VHNIPGLDGRVPNEVVGGNTPDISEYAQFDLYQYVWWHDPAVQFPDDTKKLARWIGVAHDVGNPMTYWVLPNTCKVVLARLTVWSLTDDEKADPLVQAQMADLDASIRSKIGDAIPDKEVAEDLVGLFPQVPDNVFLQDLDDKFDPAEPNATMPEADDYTPDTFNEYLTAEVLLPNGGDVTRAKVIGQKRDADGLPVGLQNNNPILDTREYEVEFPDGATDIFTAIIIAESMYSQIDGDGHSFLLMSEITDHKTDGTAVSKDNGYDVIKTGRRTTKCTTRGWKLLVAWKEDGSMSWVPLKDLKESNPVEVAEYALVNKIIEEHAFAWWAKHVLRKRDRIIRKVKS